MVNQGAVLFQKIQAEEAKKTEKQKCIDKGGTWDEATKTCLLFQKPTPQPQPQPSAPIPKGTVETFQGDNGVSGVTLPSGKSFLGLPKADVAQIANKEAGRVAIPENAQPAGTAQALAERQARLQQLSQQGLITEQELALIQEAPIDFGQALTAGTLGNLPSVASAVAGGVLGLGIGAIPGAVVGGVGGLISAIWSGTQSNIKAQQKGEINSAVDVLTNAKANMRQLRMVAETDPTRAEQALEGYYFWFNEVKKAERKVQRETQGNLNKFMEDGTETLSDFELFFAPNGYADIQRIRLEQAIIRGQSATPEELIRVYQEEIANE